MFILLRISQLSLLTWLSLSQRFVLFHDDSCDHLLNEAKGWSEQAREQTLSAFRKAGFDSSNVNFQGLRKIIMILEPEAAALHIVRSITELEAKDTFRVC